MLDCGSCFANGVKGTNGLRLAGARLRVLRGVKPAVLAILHLLAMFVADLFKPRRLEVKNLFLRHQLNIAAPNACVPLRPTGPRDQPTQPA